MGLLANGFRDSGGLYLTSGATVFNNAYPSARCANFALAGSLRNCLFGEGITDDLAGVPVGYRNGGATIMPQKAGGLVSHNETNGTLTLTGAGTLGKNGTVTISASILISEAALALISSGTASIPISLQITPPSLLGSLAADASITYSLVVNAGIGALNGANATINFSLTPTGSIASADGYMSAIISSQGDELSPTSLAAAVWNAVAAIYNTAGTMGNKMNSAASAGDPWITTLPGAYAPGSAGDIIGNMLTDMGARSVDGAYTQDEVMRLLAAVLAGKVSGAGTGTETFRDLADTKDRVVATVDANGNRTAITRDAT